MSIRRLLLLCVVSWLLILPAAAARNLARNTAQYHAFAIAISVLSGILGLIGSYYWNTASGATISRQSFWASRISAAVNTGVSAGSSGDVVWATILASSAGER